MEYTSNGRQDPPLPEIEAAEDTAIHPDDIPLHAPPLPLLSDSRRKKSNESSEEEAEPSLCKNIIYVSDTANRRIKRTNVTEVSPCSETQSCQAKEGDSLQDSKGERNSSSEKSLYRWFSQKEAAQFLSSYRMEWRHCFEFNVLAAAHYLFWENLVWGVLMGTWLHQKTGGKLGLVEVFSSSILCGSAFVLLGGHALLVVGVNASSVLFIISVSDAADRLVIDFLPWMGWIGIWGSLTLLILSVSGLCRIAKTVVTSFIWDVVQTFVVLSLLWNVAENLLSAFNKAFSLDSSLLFLWLATFSFVLASFLWNARNSRILRRRFCRTVGSSALPITLLICTGIAYLPRLHSPHLQTLDFPTTGLRTDGIAELGSLVKLKNVPLWSIFLAIIPGCLLASMVFIEHNAVSALIQDKICLNERRLKSTSWDTFLVAFLMLMSGLFGFPFCYATFLQSLKHVQALTNHKPSDVESQCWENEVKVQRISGLIASLLLGLPLVPGPSWFGAKIPLAVVIGLFIVVAIQIFSRLHIYENMKVLLLEPIPHSSSSGSTTSRTATSKYLSIQILCSLIIFITCKTPVAVVFPLFVVLAIWLRQCPLHTPFIRKGLDRFDSSLMTRHRKTRQPTEPVKIFNNPHARRRIRSAHSRIIKLLEDHCSADSDQSPKSTAILPKPTKRRLKERSLRRNKRMRHTITTHQQLQKEDHQEQDVNLHTLVLPLPCRYRLKKSQHLDSELGYPPSLKNVSPYMSKSPSLNNPIEMHSNILYDINPDTGYTPHPVASPSLLGEPTRKPTTASTANLKPALSHFGSKDLCLKSTTKPTGPGEIDAAETNRNQGACPRPMYKSTDLPLSMARLSDLKTGHSQNGRGPSNSTNFCEEKTPKELANERPKFSRPCPKLTKQEIFPCNAGSKNIVEGRMQASKSFDRASVSGLGRESSKRTKMMLNQSRWPSNKPV